jgi:hypothetical protein
MKVRSVAGEIAIQVSQLQCLSCGLSELRRKSSRCLVTHLIGQFYSKPEAKNGAGSVMRSLSLRYLARQSPIIVSDPHLLTKTLLLQCEQCNGIDTPSWLWLKKYIEALSRLFRGDSGVQPDRLSKAFVWARKGGLSFGMLFLTEN